MSASRPPPDLLSIPRRGGCFLAIAGVFGILCGGGITAALGAVGIGILFGPLLILVGLIGIPAGLWRFMFPAGHNAFAALGRDTATRTTTLQEIQRELAGPDTTDETFGSYTLSVTPNWIVLRDSSDLMIARRDTLLWAYKSVTVRKRYGVKTGETVELKAHVYGNATFTFTMTQEQVPRILERLGQAAPRAFIGYRNDLDGQSNERLREMTLGLPAAGARTLPVPAPTPSASSPTPSSSPSASSASPIVSPPPTSPLAPSARQPGGGSAVGKVMLWLGGLGAATLGVGAVSIVLCCGGLIGFGTWLEAQLAPLGEACNGHAVTGAAARTRTSEARVATHQPDGKWKIESSYLESSHEGLNLEDNAWVLCLDEPKSVALEDCGNGLTRSRWQTRARLVEAATGTVVSDEVVDGDEPAACAQVAPGSKGEGAKQGSEFWGPYLQGKLDALR
jgi:hypothetical protein